MIGTGNWSHWLAKACEVLLLLFEPVHGRQGY